jgi:AcrR family transcriptional regulator
MTNPQTGDGSEISPEHLRQTIVRAATRLMDRFDTLTTADVARAAGIDEAALLRVFDDKEAVLQATIASLHTSIAAAIDPSWIVQQLDSISLDQPLATRLVEAVNALDSHYVRMRTKLDALQQSFTALTPDAGTAGESRARSSFGADGVRAAGRLPETSQAIARLLEPDREHLCLPAEVLADAFLGMSLGAARTPHPERLVLPAGQLVDLFLHGALIVPNAQ